MSMKKVDIFFRSFLFLLVVFLAWTTWAQPANQSLIRIIEPSNRRGFLSGTNLLIEVQVDGAVAVKSVEFFHDRTLFGTVTNEPYQVTWTNVPKGTFQLTAKLNDVAGKSETSEPVEIRVDVKNVYLTFGLDRIPLLRSYEPFGFPLWHYIALLIFIFLAFYVSKVLDFLTRVWLKRWAEKTETKFDDLFLDLLNGPVRIIAFVIFLHFGLQDFPWNPQIQNFLDRCYSFIVACTVTYVILKSVDMMMGYWRERATGTDDRSFDEQLFPIVRKSLKAFVLIVSALYIIGNVFNQDIKALIASLSIGGLALGLAAQDTLANLFGAVAIFIDKPFGIGDRVKLADVDGTVETIGMRSTRIRNLDGHLITVPNKTMGNATITNITRRPNIKTTMTVGLTYDTTTEKLRQAISILDEVYRGNPMTEDLIINFNQFADSALNIQVIHWAKAMPAKEHLAMMQEMNLKLKKRFDDEKISFAFPSRTVYLRQDSDLRVQTTEAKQIGAGEKA